MSAPQNKPNYLVISSVGTDRPGIVNELAKACSSNHCNIVDSRMTVLGGEFAVIMMVSGNWDNIAKLESTLPALSQALELTTTIKHTKERSAAPGLAYSVNVVALDNPGIVHEIAQFFSTQNINIDDLHTGTYCAPHTGTQMFNLSMTIRLSADTHIASLREEFMDFCDDLNLDAVIEPIR
ncbi:MAG: glycine cleavage system protein R [Oleiphilaceae bacterium]|nr:glycine cleavage system protein R [Oleiphilaceae bacterium]